MLFLSSKCHLCEESADFHRSLIAYIGEHASDLGVMAVMPDQPQTATAYLSAHGLAISNLLPAALHLPPGFRGTPTLVLADTEGLVTNEWVGLLSPERQAEVRSVLSRIRRSDRASR